jgi:hypothetical protein
VQSCCLHVGCCSRDPFQINTANMVVLSILAGFDTNCSRPSSVNMLLVSLLLGWGWLACCSMQECASSSSAYRAMAMQLSGVCVCVCVLRVDLSHMSVCMCDPLLTQRKAATVPVTGSRRSVLAASVRPHGQPHAAGSLPPVLWSQGLFWVSLELYSLVLYFVAYFRSVGY